MVVLSHLEPEITASTLLSMAFVETNVVCRCEPELRGCALSKSCAKLDQDVTSPRVAHVKHIRAPSLISWKKALKPLH